MNKCIFCQLSLNKSIFLLERDTFFVIKDLYPQDNTHLLFISKLHIASLKDIQSKAEEDILSDIIVGITQFANQNQLNHWITQINTGKESGQKINHIHFHLISSSFLDKTFYK
jgi:histidine triad (HIT) family protein